jgi:hypothetical protein
MDDSRNFSPMKRVRSRRHATRVAEIPAALAIKNGGKLVTFDRKIVDPAPKRYRDSLVVAG